MLKNGEQVIFKVQLRHFKILTLFFWVLVGFSPSSIAIEDRLTTANKTIVNDVTKLNPIIVASIFKPHSISEIIEVVKTAKGPVSIGGGRYSMGGQTATEGAVQLDMQEFNKIIAFSLKKKEITVQSGATWRQIQEFIDQYDLSIKIMQTYSDFTVGGSLSVNVHGRYIGYGPIVLSVKKIGIILADGSYIHASPTENSNIFYGAIGGYGGIGVITEATLELAANTKIHRVSKVMPASKYKDFFFSEVRSNPNAIFHNADIYPNAYDTVRATTFEESELPLSIKDRLISEDKSYWLDRALIRLISEAPGGKLFRQYVLDPILFFGKRVTWRNYEASYTVLELEPASRRDSTYVLQEYFVPVERINEFMPKMAYILNEHKVNVLNISIRHSKQDPGTFLAWAKQEGFAFVLYYKQGTKIEDKEQVGIWTRELVNSAIGLGGSYYLPYQIQATEEQFKTAYPDWGKFFSLKKKVDPLNIFRNKLWDAYYNLN